MIRVVKVSEELSLLLAVSLRLGARKAVNDPIADAGTGLARFLAGVFPIA